jgi:nitrite reductase (NADH) small subunit
VTASQASTPDTSAAPQGAGEDWQPVCRVVELEVERGATALVHGQALAVFRTHDDQVFALGNHDPFAHASVLARGIVGTRGDVPFVASPMHKHAFDLRTGRCLDDEHVSVPVYEVRIVEGVVLVGHRRPSQS